MSNGHELAEPACVVPSQTSPEAPDVATNHGPIRSKWRMSAILISLYLSFFIAALDQTIVATTIPVIVADLGSGPGYFWIGGAFLLANACAAPVWAKVSDIWGRRPALLGAVSIFTVGSTLTATSTSMRMLIAARALQGTAAGGMVQLVTIVLSDLFSMRSRALYFGLLEATWALAGGMGPVFGGALTQLVNWRCESLSEEQMRGSVLLTLSVCAVDLWPDTDESAAGCFWINLPVSGTIFMLLALFLNVHNPQTPLHAGILAVDWFGILSIIALTVMLLLGLDFGGVIFRWDSATVLCLLSFGAMMILIFMVSERKLAKYPLVPISTFNNRSTISTFMVVFCQGMVFIGGTYYLPLFFQSVKGASPLKSGLLIIPTFISEAAMGCLSGVFIHQTGRYREMIWIGTFLMTLGYGLFITYEPETPTSVLVGLGIIGGLGPGLLYQPPLVTIQAMVSQADTATATACMAFARAIATAFSVVIGGVIFQNGMDSRLPSLQAAGLDASLLSSFSHGRAVANVEVIKTITNSVHRQLVREAYAWSLRNLWIAYTGIAGISLLASLSIRHRDLSREHRETRTGIGEMTEKKLRINGA